MELGLLGCPAPPVDWGLRRRSDCGRFGWGVKRFETAFT